jgi:hypothetical protein
MKIQMSKELQILTNIQIITQITSPEAPSWFLTTIEQIINTALETPANPPLMFTLTEEAAQHNMQLLQRHDNCIQKLIEAYPGSFISPGSKF